MTTSAVLITFSKVCLVVLSLTRLAGEKISTGGLALNTLKKLKGDKLGFPDSSTVLANAIGRGPIAPNKYPCKLPIASSEGSKEIVASIDQQRYINCTPIKTAIL